MKFFQMDVFMLFPSFDRIFRLTGSVIDIDNFSSNINEVVRVVINSLFFFYEKIFTRIKKYQKASKSTKSIKRYKDTQTKAQHQKHRKHQEQ